MNSNDRTVARVTLVVIGAVINVLVVLWLLARVLHQLIWQHITAL